MIPSQFNPGLRLVNKAFDIGLYMDNQPGMMILPVWGRNSYNAHDGEPPK